MPCHRCGRWIERPLWLPVSALEAHCLPTHSVRAGPTGAPCAAVCCTCRRHGAPQKQRNKHIPAIASSILQTSPNNTSQTLHPASCKHIQAIDVIGLCRWGRNWAMIKAVGIQGREVVKVSPRSLAILVAWALRRVAEVSDHVLFLAAAGSAGAGQLALIDQHLEVLLALLAVRPVSSIAGPSTNQSARPARPKSSSSKWPRPPPGLDGH